MKMPISRIPEIVLGAITIAELAFTKQMVGSLVLWILYGIYKVVKLVND